MGIFRTIISYITAFIISLQATAALPVLSTNFRFEAEASVFETGDDMYTIIWSTTRPGSGFVTYTYDGKEVKVDIPAAEGAGPRDPKLVEMYKD